MATKVGFLEESEGQKSSMRLFSFILLMFFCVFNIFYVTQRECEIDFNFIFYNTVILIGVFAPKYLQKLAELKLGEIKQTDTKPKQ